MRVQYDPRLIEHIVFEAARLDPKFDAQLHRTTNPYYELDDLNNREQRFQEAYRDAFQRLKLDLIITDLIAEHPIIEQCAPLCIVKEAPARRKEAADLYVKRPDDPADAPDTPAQTVFIWVYPASMLDRTALASRMRRELLHVADMLDEKFGYQKESLTGNTPAENLTRDRYRVLWDIYTEGRLDRNGHGDNKVASSLQPQFERVFTGHTDRHSSQAVQRVFQAADLTHDQLLAWSETPQLLLESDGPAGGRDTSVACPLCQFPTFDWLDLAGDHRDLIAAVQADHPQGQPDHGICRQCAEIYCADASHAS